MDILPTGPVINTLKVITPAALAFFIGIGITPFLTDFLYRNKMWKKKVRTKTMDGKEAVVFQSLHKEKEVGTPKMGGIIIWGSALVTILLLWALSLVIDTDVAQKLNFLSRGQTWVPLFALMMGAGFGFLDDYFEVTERKDYVGGGMSLKKRLLVVTLISLASGWWFYSKLGVSEIHIPFNGDINIGILFIPFFLIVTLGLYSGGVIDGIDGLAGGVFSSMFAAYGVIAFANNQINLAAFCFVLVGALLAFLWFNIPPARFYMSETGSMALTVTLSVVAFLTQEVLLLLIIAFPLVATVASNVIQMTSKKFRDKKVFQIAPLHHHFEALGWPNYKVTMRYWIISLIFAFMGVILALLG
ncbi:MAG: hypothetical protein WD579_01175 [Candidatus Paceibacterota bacterium]